MLSDTLSEGLVSYRIGPKIRGLRKSKKLGLSQLGEHTGLSAGMLSRIERDQVFPTLPTLLRIAMVFGVGLNHFFSEDIEKPVLEVVRKSDRMRLPNTPDGTPAFYFESLDYPVSNRPVGAYLAEFPIGAGASEAHSHAGVELIYVIRGNLTLIIHGRDVALGPGDSVYFDAGHDHSYFGGSETPCQALVVVAETREALPG